MQTTQLHDDDFFKILWDENARIIGVDWKEATSAMTVEQFKEELTLFAGHVEQKKAREFLWMSAVFATGRAGRAALAGKEHLKSLQRCRRMTICLPLPRRVRRSRR